MWKTVLILTISVLCLPAFAQTTGNSITVTATRGVNVQPDQVLFGISVRTALTASLDDVLSALQGSGIALANFSGVNTNQTSSDAGDIQQVLAWGFTISAALSNMKSTVASLTQLQKNIAQKNSQMGLSFYVQGTQVSPQLLQAQQTQLCGLPDLVADARSQAQKIAGAAGMGLGTILAISGAVINTSGASTTATAYSAVSSPTCSLTMKFALWGGY